MWVPPLVVAVFCLIVLAPIAEAADYEIVELAKVSEPLAAWR